MEIAFRFLFIVCLCIFIHACQNNSEPTDSSDIEISEVEDIDQNDIAVESLTDTEDSVVLFATSLLGTPYREAGKDTSGFDCSGFVSYVFKNYDIEIPSSSRHMAVLGEEISVEDARQGDLIFFRGTDSTSKEVGHVGIVVSDAGDPIKFIHSSSVLSSPCVKFDSLAKPNYKRRFMMVKRVIEK